jgi:cytochrome c oxidase cbb3-type subunit 3
MRKVAEGSVPAARVVAAGAVAARRATCRLGAGFPCRVGAAVLAAALVAAGPAARAQQPTAPTRAGAAQTAEAQAPPRTLAPSRTLAERIAVDSPYAIMANDEEAAFVEAAANKAIAEHCAACHGADLKGKRGVPDLTDYDFLWGITLEDTNDVGPVRQLEQTILYGIRNQDCPPALAALAAYGDCPDTRYSEMPAFGDLGMLNKDQIHDIVEYVLSLSGQPADAAAAARGKVDFDDDCTECHGAKAQGYKVFGGPNLTDKVWLYGGDRASLTETLTKGRLGRCPAWVDKLDEATIKSLAVYIWLHER